MNESTSKSGGPLIPTISTLDQDSPVTSLGQGVAIANDDLTVVRVIVETVIEIEPGSPTTAVIRSVISSPASSPEERKDNIPVT
jgi:hypothetical protein